MDDLDIFDSFDFPQPAAFSLQYPFGGSLFVKAEPSSAGLCLYKRGDNHLEVYRAQRLLNCYIRGNLGIPWTKSNGSLWPLLREDGMLDLDTELALNEFQLGWGLQPSGCLCPRTRMLLPPHMRLKGSLLLRKPGRYLRPCLPPTFGQSKSTGSVSNSTPSPNPPVKPPAPNPAPSGGAGSTSTGSKDDDDKPWTVHITGSMGVGLSGPVWTGKSSTGNSVKAETLEVDTKTEIDVSVPTSLRIGKGHLKLTLAGEYDEPLDNAHLGKPTVQATFQLQADDAIKFGEWGSLSPFAQVSSQWQKDDKWKQSTVLKGGLELDINLAKGVKLAADVNSGAQFAGPGNDPKTTAKAVVPLEGNLKLQWDF